MEMPQTSQTEAETWAVQNITERLDEITSDAKRANRKITSGMFLGIFCFVAGIGLIQMFLNSDNLYSPALFLLLAVIVFIGLSLNFLAMLKLTPKFDGAEVTHAGGVQAIAPLFATLEITPSSKQEQAIRDALTTLLPLMKASDANLLSNAARQTIHSWLDSPARDRPVLRGMDALRLASLKALEQVGDSSAIPVVERWTLRTPRTPGEAKIKQAAIDCLPMLRAHCGEVDAARTLLRASHSEDARPDTLLRPASGGAQTNAAELLRGADLPDTARDSGENLS